MRGIYDEAEQFVKRKENNIAKGTNKTGTAQSAPYLRLKNGKRTAKCQVISSTVPDTNEEKTFQIFFRNFL